MLINLEQIQSIIDLPPFTPKNAPLVKRQPLLAWLLRLSIINTKLMTRLEKIEYIRGSRMHSYAYQDLESLNEYELDEIIRRIAFQLQRQEVMISENMVTDFYVFLN